MFCPKCGSLLIPKKEGKGKILQCSCGFKEKNLKDMEIIEEVTSKRDIELIENDDTEKTLPKTEVECPKCGNREAYYWTIQTRAGDEPETKFLKCTKCKHTWRDYT